MAEDERTGLVVFSPSEMSKLMCAIGSKKKAKGWTSGSVA